MFWLLLSFIGLLLLLEYFIKNTPEFKEFRKLPYIKGIPILGNVLQVKMNATSLFYMARMLSSITRTQGNIMTTCILLEKAVHLYDPTDIEVVMSSPKYIAKSRFYNFLHAWMKDGLLTSLGEKWQKRRKILTPTFHFNILRQFCKVFVEQSYVVVEQLKEEVGKEETDVLPIIIKFTLHSISETAMGTNLDDSQTAASEYKKAVFDIGELMVRRFTRVWLHPPAIYNRTATGKEEMRLLKTLHGFTTKVIRERRAARSEEDNKLEVEDMDDEALGQKKRMAMLDLLLKAEAEGKINEDGIREEVDTFMFEGHDTVTMALMFLLLALANNQDVQEKVLAEINDIIGDTDRQATIEDLNKMSYTEMCIKETLRLYPSVPFIARRLSEEMTLRGAKLCPGTEVFIHVFDVHRNPDLYPDPERFIPERFTLENSRERHPYAYIPFSAGPRNCIGQRFAILEQKAFVAAILRNYKLLPVTRPEEVVFNCDIILRSRDQIKVKFVPRN